LRARAKEADELRILDDLHQPDGFLPILFPGTLLTWLLMGEVGPVVLGDRYTRLDGVQAWAAFRFSSHRFGDLVLLLGTWLDEFFDWARRSSLDVHDACR
jgi:hypothetical protein